MTQAVYTYSQADLADEPDPQRARDMGFIPCVAILLWHREQRKVVSVTRKNDSTRWTLPGGKVELGETYTAAAVRELREETGLFPGNPFKPFAPVFATNNYADKQCFTMTFWTSLYQGEFRTQEPHLIDFKTPEELVLGPFGDYYAQMFTNVGYRWNVA